MNRFSKGLFIAAASVAMTGVAFAEDEAGAPPAEGSEVQPPPDGTPPPTATAPTGGEFTAETWPKDYVNRPQNIYKGGIEISPRFGLDYTKTVDTAGNETSSTVTSLSVSGRYGVTDKIEALASYDGITLTGVEGISTGDRLKGQLLVGGGLILAKGKLDLEAKVALGYDFAGETAPLLAGVDVRYHISPKMWVGTPVNRPGLVAFLKGFDDGMGGTLSPLFFQLPAAFAFQATPELAIQANTNIFTIAFNDAGKLFTGGESVGFIFTDEGGGIPLDLDVIYALSNKMDVQANLDLGDLKNIGDAFALTAGVNIRL